MTEKNPPSHRIAEFNTLRDEILRSDNTCLLITGYLIALVATLFANNLQWLTSFFAFIALCYFTEKRFIIRQIATYIREELNDVSQWEEKIEKLRTSKPGLRPTNIFRPYNTDIFICISIALLPLFVSDLQVQLYNLTGYAIFWLILFLAIVYLSIVNGIQYNFKFLKKEIWKIISAIFTIVTGGILTRSWVISLIVILLFFVGCILEKYFKKYNNTQ